MQTESPVHHSNVMAYSTKEKVRSRVGHKCGGPCSLGTLGAALAAAQLGVLAAA